MAARLDESTPEIVRGDSKISSENQSCSVYEEDTRDSTDTFYSVPEEPEENSEGSASFSFEKSFHLLSTVEEKVDVDWNVSFYKKNIEILNEKHGMLTIVVLIIRRSFKCDDYVSFMHRINKEWIANCRTVKVYVNRTIFENNMFCNDTWFNDGLITNIVSMLIK